MSQLRLVTTLGMDGTGFHAGIGKARAAVAGLSGQMNSSMKGAVAAAFGVGAITMAVRKTIEYADAVEEASNRIGVGADKWQEWTFAAKQAGVTTEKLLQMVDRLNKMAETKEGKEFFAKWGINANQGGAGLFQDVWIKANSLDPKQARQMLSGIGRGDSSFINLFSANMEESAEAARRMGAVMDETSLLKLSTFADRLSVVSQVLLSSFAPAILVAADALLYIARVGSLAVERWASQAMLTKEDLANSKKNLYVPYAHLMDPEFYKNMKSTNPLMWTSSMSNPFYNVTSEVAKSIQKNAAAQDAADANRFSDFLLQGSAIREMIERMRNSRIPDGSDFLDRSAQDEKAKKLGAIKAGDDLVKVGNFLGAGGSVVQSIAQQQLDTLKQHTQIFREIKMELRNPRGLDLGIP